MSYICQLNHGNTSLDYVKEILKNISEGTLEQKFFYCNTLCAYNWIHLVEDIQHYRLADQARRMFDKYIDTLLRNHIKDTNISVISLGIGNGYDDKELISRMLKKNKQLEKITYYPYDISHELITYVNRKINTIPNCSNKIEIIAIEDDFKNIQNYSQKFNSDQKPKLFCFLGSTISNFHETTLLTKIKGVMSEADYLLIGVDCALDKVDEDKLYTHSADSHRGLNFLYGPIKSMLSYIQIPEIDNPIGFEFDDDFKKSVEKLDSSLLQPRTNTDIESSMSNFGDVCTIAYNLSTINSVINFTHKYKTETVENYLTKKMQFQIVDRVTTKDTQYSHVFQSNDTCSYSLFLVKKPNSSSKRKLTDYEIDKIRTVLGKNYMEKEKNCINAAYFIDAIKANSISYDLYLDLIKAQDYPALNALKEQKSELGQIYNAQKNIQENAKK